MSTQQHHDFETLVRESTQFLKHLAHSLLQQEEGVEDVLQESFEHAYRNWPTFLEQGQARLGTHPWLLTLVREAATAYLAQQIQTVSLDELRADTHREIKASPWQCPEQVVARQEVLCFLTQELDQLCPRERTAFLERFLKGKPYEEIAQALHVSKRTAIVYAYRGRQLLRWKVQKHHLNREGQLFWDQTCEVVITPAASPSNEA